MFNTQKSFRDDGIIVKLKCNGCKSITTTLEKIIKIIYNKDVKFSKIDYNKFIKDATKQFNINFFSLTIWEILTLDNENDKNYQKTNEKIIYDYITNNLNDDDCIFYSLLKMKFIDYIKSDYLLSTKEYNKKYKFEENFENKYLFEKKFNGEEKEFAQNLIKYGILEHLNYKSKRVAKNEKYNFKSSEKISQSLNIITTKMIFQNYKHDYDFNNPFNINVTEYLKRDENALMDNKKYKIHENLENSYTNYMNETDYSSSQNEWIIN